MCKWPVSTGVHLLIRSQPVVLQAGFPPSIRRSTKIANDHKTYRKFLAFPHFMAGDEFCCVRCSTGFSGSKTSWTCWPWNWGYEPSNRPQLFTNRYSFHFSKLEYSAHRCENLVSCKIRKVGSCIGLSQSQQLMTIVYGKYVVIAEGWGLSDSRV